MVEGNAGDEQLVEGLRAGEQVAHLEFAKRYGPRIIGFIKAMPWAWAMTHQDVEEIAADTVYKAIAAIARFDSSRAKFKTWVLRIAQNVGLDRARQSQRLQDKFEGDFDSYEAIEEATGNEPGRAVPVVESTVVRLSLAERIVKAALERLSPTECIVIIEHMYEQSVPEIAAALGKSEPAVRTALTRAKKNLRRACEEIISERSLELDAILRPLRGD